MLAVIKVLLSLLIGMHTMFDLVNWIFHLDSELVGLEVDKRFSEQL